MKKEIKILIIIIILVVVVILVGLWFFLKICGVTLPVIMPPKDEDVERIFILFPETEVICTDSRGRVENLEMKIGKTNSVLCWIKAKEKADYKIELKEIYLINKNIEVNPRDWIVGNNFWRGYVAPGNEIPERVLLLKIPETIKRDILILRFEIHREGLLISVLTLDFELRGKSFKEKLCNLF